jgi:8-oxo-dGTP pyrophosphatase MutT (NUDIX family)
MSQSIERIDDRGTHRKRLAAAIVIDAFGRVLLVRKRDTVFFMQPGGKGEAGETPLQTLARELNEELGCTLLNAHALGIFCAPAVNEPGATVEAMLFQAEIGGSLRPGAEIEDIA